MNEMRIANAAVDYIANEGEIIDKLLALAGATVLELGCGRAEKTQFIARKAASVLALEVDQMQLSINKTLKVCENIVFEQGGAEAIPAADSQFDHVLMFKSLHHVPVHLMEQAFAEIHRVLKPGGTAYISEPVFAGHFNEILKLFHDEQLVREHAFSAVKNAVSSGQFALTAQEFFLQPTHFENFAQMEQQVINVTHTDHRLTDAQLAQVRTRFEQHMTPDGAYFKMPIRVDLLRKN
jgi:ubiquinone/menaquinone biosynthesis C-methylase UbiE